MSGTKKPNIADALDTFVGQIDGLREALPLSMIVIQAVSRAAQKNYQAFIDENCTEREEDGRSVVNVPIDHDHRFSILHRRTGRAHTAREIVPRSFLVSLVSQYDAFLGSLVRAIFNSRPEMLRSSGLTLSFSQLSEFSSIDAARDYILEKEVENLLRGSHSDHFYWMENKFDVKLRKDLPVWPTFVEVAERRNLFVHCDGHVSSQYLRVCRENNVQLDPATVLGSKLAVSPAYFESAYRAILEIGVKLAHVLWRKTNAGDLKLADENLTDITFNLLRDEQNDLAVMLLEFACTTLKDRHFNEEHRRIFLVNLAQAHKWSGNPAKANAIIGAEDWTAASNKFKLAKAVLSDDFGSAAELIRLIGAAGEIHKAGYRD